MPLRWTFLLKVGAFVGLIIAANYAAALFADMLNITIRPNNEDFVHRMIMLSAAVYAVFMAIPFVPGMEIGIAMIGLLGPPIAFLIYICTVVGLSTSFLIGRIVPLSGLIRLFDDLGLHRAAETLKSIEPLDGAERLDVLVAMTPNRLVPFLLRNRYLTLAVVLNLPGNILLGGGGGIALFAGVSRLYSMPGFFLTIVCAVAPVPLAVFFFGQGIMPI